MYKNFEMERMVKALEKHLDRKDVIGYAAARNTRALTEELIEYENMREDLVTEYGEEELDEAGNPTGKITLKFDSPDFPKVASKMDEFALIEHDPKIFKIKYTDVIGELSGTEIMEIDWMLED